MLIALLSVTLASLPNASPAKAGVQLPPVRNWAPAFAGEVEGDGPGGIDAKDITPIDAERAFAADAKTIGQWTAFRKWSTDDAVMFVPQPTKAHAFLKDRKNPARAIDWWPTASYISCDGKTAVNTGGWTRPDGVVGYFTTVWQKQPDDGWKWVVDGGDGLKVARERPTEPKVVRASCARIDAVSSNITIPPGAKLGEGRSADDTLHWHWQVMPDGTRLFLVWLADGSQSMPTVINDNIPAPPK